jgi:hypothetical protein
MALVFCCWQTPALAEEAPAPEPNADVAADSAPEPNLLPWIIGGVGGAAIIAGGVLAIVGGVERSNADSECAPYCHPDVSESIRTKWIAGGLAASGGVLLIAVAAMTSALTRPDHEQLPVALIVTDEGAFASLQFRF